jgi:hypothetical protein
MSFFPKESKPEHASLLFNSGEPGIVSFYVKGTNVYMIINGAKYILSPHKLIVDIKKKIVIEKNVEGLEYRDCTDKFMNALLYFGATSKEDYELEKQFENLSTKEIEEIDDALEKEYVDALGTEEVEEEWNLLFGRRRRPRSTRRR